MAGKSGLAPVPGHRSIGAGRDVLRRGRSPGGEAEYFSPGFTAEVAEDTEWRSPAGEEENSSAGFTAAEVAEDTE